MAKKTKATTAGAAAAATKLAAAATAAGTQARTQAGDLGERLAPVVIETRDRLAPVVDDARERLVDLTGTVATRIDDLTGTVAARLDDALPDRVTPAAVSRRAAKGHPNRLLQALFVLALGAVAAAVTHRLTGGGFSQEVWRSASDSPTRPGESAPSVFAGQDHASGNVPGDPSNDAGEVGPVQTSVDVAGGTPEEMAADATDTPHAVTTPDQPAQKVVLD